MKRVKKSAIKKDAAKSIKKAALKKSPPRRSAAQKSSVGSISPNFHEGSRSEYLAQYVFSAYGFTDAAAGGRIISGNSQCGLELGGPFLRFCISYPVSAAVGLGDAVSRLARPGLIIRPLLRPEICGECRQNTDHT
jgi:hypothetical protein